MTKTPFREFFDIDNRIHREAYLYCRAHGAWPESFHDAIREHDMEPLWYVMCSERYIGWLEKKLERK